MNARERAAALVALLEPRDPVPCHVLAELLAEVEVKPTLAEDAPVHPDGWTVNALASRYMCSLSSMRARVAGGEFGVAHTAGGPRIVGRSWLVPHAAVLARDRRVQEGMLNTNVTPTTLQGTLPRTASCVSLADARRQRLGIGRRQRC